MRTIKEIFANNHELLESPEVKELINEFHIQFKANTDRYTDYWQKVTDLTMNSEYFVLNGIDCKKAVEEIHKLSFK